MMLGLNVSERTLCREGRQLTLMLETCACVAAIVLVGGIGGCRAGTAGLLNLRALRDT